MQQQQRTDQEIIGSRLVAKAIIESEGRGIEIIAIFELSEYHRYYFIFSARTKRSPRRCWKYQGQRASIYQGSYMTLKEFADRQIGWRHGQVLMVRRYCRKANFDGLRERIIHPPQQAPISSTAYANRITSGAKATEYNRRPSWANR